MHISLFFRQCTSTCTLRQINDAKSVDMLFQNSYRFAALSRTMSNGEHVLEKYVCVVLINLFRKERFCSLLEPLGLKQNGQTYIIGMPYR